MSILTLQVWGARGGTNVMGVPGGLGGYAAGELAVTPGDVLYLYVGGMNGYNGGGLPGTSGCSLAIGGPGGGATDIKHNGQSLGDRVIVGGGGGGAGGNRVAGCGRGTGGGGGGGYYGGGGGSGWAGGTNSVITTATGGSQSAGGLGGISSYAGAFPANTGSSGSLAIGGNGGAEFWTVQAGSGTGPTGGIGGGLIGGNGIYFPFAGGGSSSEANYTGMSGAGGSSYIGGVQNGSTQSGASSGNGMAVIIYPPTISPPVTAASQTICTGDSVVLQATGMTTFTWNTGAATPSIAVHPTVTNSYSVTGLYQGCIASTIFPVVVDETFPVVSVSGLTVCEGAPAILMAGGAHSYTWSGGVTNGVPFVPAASGVFSVTGANLCGISTATAMITLIPSPSITAGASSATICQGSALTLTATGSGTVSWSHGVTNGQTFQPPSTAVYTASVLGANGCVTTTQVPVTVNDFTGSVVGLSAGPATVCAGNPAVVTASGVVSYSWSHGPQVPTVTVSPTAATIYSVSGVNSDGCISGATIAIQVDSPPSVSAQITATTVCQGDPVTVSATGASTYVWSGGITGGQPFVPAASGNYTVTGSNACGTGSDVVSVSVLPNPTLGVLASNPTVCAGNTVAILASGASSYTWTGGIINGQPFTPVATGNYTVNGSAPNGCTATAITGVTVLPLPVVNAVAAPGVICAGESTTLSAGAVGNFTWLPINNTNGTVVVSPASAMVYTLVQFDGNCVNSATASVGVNALPVLVPAANQQSVCSGQPAVLSVTGAQAYTWSPGGWYGSNFNPVPSSSTIYTVTGAANGCRSTTQVSVTVLALPQLTLTATPSVICSGETTTVTAHGAMSYTWIGSGANGSVNILTPPSQVTVTATGSDAVGCVNAAAVVIKVNQTPQVLVSASHKEVCAGTPVFLQAFGAVSYSWSNGATTPGITEQPAVTTVYSVTGSGQTGCAITKTVEIKVLNLLLSVSGPTAVCVGGSVTFTASGATSYVWTGNKTGATATYTPSVGGNYFVTGSTSNGTLTCSGSIGTSITVHPLPVVTIVASSTSVCRNEGVKLTAGGATTYSWSNGQTGAVISPTVFAPETFTVTGTNANGCTKSATVKIITRLCAGLADVSADQVSVFPNPAGEVVYISSPADLEMTLVNSLGQIVCRLRCAGGTTARLDVTHLQEGVYHLTTAGGSGMAAKVVVQR